MFCGFCGNKVDDNAKFCENCGSRLSSDSAPTYPTGNGYSAPETPYSQPGSAYTQPGAGYTQPGTGYTQPGAGYTQPSAGYTQPGAANDGWQGAAYSGAGQTQRRGSGVSVNMEPEARILGIPVRGKAMWIVLAVIAVIVIVILAVVKLGGGSKETVEDEPTRSFAVEKLVPESTPEAAPAGSVMDEIAGLYKLTAMTTEEEGDLDDNIELMEGFGLAITLRLDADGTGVMDTYGDESAVFWDEDTISMDGSAIRYTYANGELTLEDGGNRMVLRRTTEAELRALEDAGNDFWNNVGDLSGAEEAAGYYYATACYKDGEDAGVDDEYLYLGSDGTGYFNLIGMTFSFDWQLIGEAFYFEDESGDEFIGTLADGVIEGEYFDGYYYVFERDKLMSASAANGGDMTYDPYAFTTSETPTLSDFQWLTNDIAYGGLPSDRDTLDDFDEVSGGWKCYLIDDLEGRFNTYMERMLNVYITGTADRTDVTFDWYYAYDGSTDQGFDDDSFDSVFSGSWSDGVIEALGEGKVTLTDFWYLNGKEYAVGTFMWPDGVTAGMFLTRP